MAVTLAHLTVSARPWSPPILTFAVGCVDCAGIDYLFTPLATHLRVFPIAKRALLFVAACALAPLCPLLLIDGRFLEIVVEVGRTVF